MSKSIAPHRTTPCHYILTLHVIEAAEKGKKETKGITFHVGTRIQDNIAPGSLHDYLFKTRMHAALQCTMKYYSNFKTIVHCAILHAECLKNFNNMVQIFWLFSAHKTGKCIQIFVLYICTNVCTCIGCTCVHTRKRFPFFSVFVCNVNLHHPYMRNGCKPIPCLFEFCIQCYLSSGDLVSFSSFIALVAFGRVLHQKKKKNYKEIFALQVDKIFTRKKQKKISN